MEISNGTATDFATDFNLILLCCTLTKLVSGALLKLNTTVYKK